MRVLLPLPVHRDYGEDMAALVADRLDGAPSGRARTAVCLAALGDLVRHSRALRSMPSPATARLRSRSRTDSPRRRRRLDGRSPTMRTSSVFDALWRDLRFGVRSLRKDPGFTLTTVVTLSLAIGANAAVLGLADATFLRPLPYPEPDRLALVARTYPGSDAASEPSTSTSQDGLTWEVVRDGAHSLRAAPYSDWITGVNLAAGGAALYVQQQRVGSGYFGVLGVAPALGREFTAEEDLPEGAKVAILSHGLWQRVFEGDRSILGETILLRGEPYVVTGIMPEAFVASQDVDIWTPLRPSRRGEGGGTNYAIVARLRDTTSWPQADAEITALAALVNAELPADWARIGLSLQPLQQALAESARMPLRLLSIAVALVLVVACVNLSGLLTVRSDRRRGELATRLALGGSRWAVSRQLAVEGVLLAAASAVGAVVVATQTLQLFRELGAEVLGIWRPVQVDTRLLLLILGLAAAAAALFAALPALRIRRLAGRGALGSRSRAVAGPVSRLPRRAMLIGQVALAVALLIGAGVLLRSYLHLSRLDPGFDPTDVHSVRVSFEDARYATRAQVEATLQEGLARVRAVPGVETAGASLGLPYERLLNLGFRLPEGDLQIANAITNLGYVTPGTFEALRMSLVRGRAIEIGDTFESAPVAVVNEAFVSEYLTDGWAVGRRVHIADVDREIVGVVKSAQQRPSWGQFEPLRPVPMVYVPLSQLGDGFLRAVHGWFQPAWVIRLAGRGVDRAAVDAALASVDPLLPLASTASLAEVREGTLAPQRLLAGLLAVLAAAAVFLAALGIHGAVASSVNERARELGIRVALGATPGGALRAVVVPGMLLAVGGAGLGCLLAVGSTRVIESMVWGISALDPTTYVAVVLLLLAVTAVAILLPARRILRMDPAASLRAQ